MSNRFTVDAHEVNCTYDDFDREIEYPHVLRVIIWFTTANGTRESISFNRTRAGYRDPPDEVRYLVQYHGRVLRVHDTHTNTTYRIKNFPHPEASYLKNWLSDVPRHGGTAVWLNAWQPAWQPVVRGSRSFQPKRGQ